MIDSKSVFSFLRDSLAFGGFTKSAPEPSPDSCNTFPDLSFEKLPVTSPLRAKIGDENFLFVSPASEAISSSLSIAFCAFDHSTSSNEYQTIGILPIGFISSEMSSMPFFVSLKNAKVSAV